MNAFNHASISGKQFWGCVVIADISGFTALGNALAHVATPHESNASETETLPEGGTELGRAGSETARDLTYERRQRSHEYPFTARSLNESSAQKGLAQRQGADNLVTIINEYFNRIIAVAHEFGGDVIKFAGQPQSAAVFCDAMCSILDVRL